MILTICLRTKGREKFLEQILNSFESSLKDPSIQFLILDNGTPISVSTRLNAWMLANPTSVDIVRLERNYSGESIAWWQVLQSRAIDWVVFPGDDDEFVPEIIDEWRLALKSKPHLVGFATSAAVMDENGVLTGEILIPSAIQHTSKMKQIANAFHEPPFLWPSLFLRLSQLPRKVPNSRFVFDWWIGLHLLLAGEVQISQSVGINYRVHKEQESFLAPLRRKYFEAQLWFDVLLHEEPFRVWCARLDDASRLAFWNQVTQTLPIYGHPIFSKPILATIYREIICGEQSSECLAKITADFALLNGVLLKGGEIKDLLTDRGAISQFDLGNVQIFTVPDTCKKVCDASDLIHGSDSSKIFQVSCEHSKNNSESIKIDCSKLIDGSPLINADLLIYELTTFCENQHDFDFTLTNGEQAMVNLFRTWKRRLPRHLRELLKRLKRSVELD